MENGSLSTPESVPVSPSGDGVSGKRSRSGSASSVSHKLGLSSSLFSKLPFTRNQPNGSVAERGNENGNQLRDGEQSERRKLTETKIGGAGGKAMASAFQQQIRTRRRKGSLRKTALLGTGMSRVSPKGLPSRAMEVTRDVSPEKDESHSADAVPLPEPPPPEKQDENTTPSQSINHAPAPRPPTPPVRPPPQPPRTRPLTIRNDHQEQKQTMQSIGSHQLSENRRSISSIREDAPTDDEDLLSFPPLSNTISTLSSQTSTSSISALSSLPPRRLPLSIPTPSSGSDSYFRTSRASLVGSMPQIFPHSPPQRVRSPLATSTTELASKPESWDYSETEWWGWIILIVTWFVFVVGMGSCLGVWSWAWDVGETPYAPPELEDDPTLPIVGYYPALIILTAVMAWVWVVVAWMGMKYFRHANISGEDI